MQVIRVNGRFRLRDNLGSRGKCKYIHTSTSLPAIDSFQGTLFRAVDLADDRHSVLVKTSTQSLGWSPLQQECRILDELHGAPGIPDIIWQGTEYELDAVVFENIGPTLKDVFQAAGKKLPVSVVAFLAEQLVCSHQMS